MDRTRHVEIKSNHEAISWMDGENTKRQTQFQKPFKFRECNLYSQNFGVLHFLSRCSRFSNRSGLRKCILRPTFVEFADRSRKAWNMIPFSLQQSAVLPFPETSVCCTSQRIPKFSVCQMTGVALMYLSRSMSKAGEEETRENMICSMMTKVLRLCSPQLAGFVVAGMLAVSVIRFFSFWRSWSSDTLW